jgi:hypothetical protein
MTKVKRLRGASGLPRILRLAGIAISAAALAACASARQVVILPDGGVVAVAGRTAANMAKAGEIMAGRCPGGYEITREEEVPVGGRYEEETTHERDRKDRVTSKTEVRMRTKYEWRIHYTCRQAGP